MSRQIETVKKTRLYLLDAIKDLSVEQLNRTPEGFNNNIIWNVGHLIAAQQGVCYLRSGAPLAIEQKHFDLYKPGTKPGEFVNYDEVQRIKDLLLTTLDTLQLDYNNNTFNGYKPWTTRYGVELNNIEQALDFLSFHEGYHSGIVASLKKIVCT